MPRVARTPLQQAHQPAPEPAQSYASFRAPRPVAAPQPPAPVTPAVPTLVPPGLPVGARLEDLPPQSPLAVAIDTLSQAAQTLQRLADQLPADDAFKNAVELLLERGKGYGRAIITGVGKPGHIGKKIAATMASTGTPALFVHPVEALHGDLGMITAQDTVIMMSHSGESKELMPVLTYVQRFKIPLIAITGRPASTLGRAATCVLNTGVQREACPLNLAPTTSTTATLALGDALAVALMTARGFGAMDFAVFHPGGKLGAQLLRVSEIMLTDNLPLLPITAPMHQLLVELTQKNVGCVGLVDAAGRLCGIFTDGDLKRRLLASEADHSNLMQKTATEVMTRNPKTITPETMAVAGVARFQQENIKDLWVVDPDHQPLGLFRLDTCLARGVV